MFVSRINHILLAVVALCFPFGAVRANERELCDQALAGYSDCIRSIDSYDVLCTFDLQSHLIWRAPKDYREMSVEQRQSLMPEFLPPIAGDSTRRIWMSRQFRSGARLRIECFKNLDGEYTEGQRLYVWDGNLAKFYNARRNSGVIEASATEFDLLGTPAPRYELLYKAAFGDYNYAKFVRDRDSQCIREGDKYVIDAQPQPTSLVLLGVYGLRVVIDPSKNFLPERLEFSTQADGKPRILKTVVENTLTEVGPGLWMPTAARFEFYVGDPKSPQFGQIYESAQFSIDMERSRFNVPLEDQLFVHNYPVGTEISDRARGVRFVVGAQTQEETLNEIAANGRLMAERMQSFQGGHTRRSLFPAVLIVNAVLIFILCVATVWRRKRKVRSSPGNE